MEISAEEQDTCGWKRRQKFRENLDKLLDIGESDAIEQIKKKNRLMSSSDKAEDIAFFMDQCSARKRSIRGSGMVFSEKKRRQEERKETETKKFRGTSPAPSAQALGVVKPVQAWIAVLLLWIIWRRR